MRTKSQSALEYMMTYGWAILIIVIVAAVLYSLGIFSPSSSISATVTGFAGLGTVSASCVQNQGLYLTLGDSTGNLINISQIELISGSKKYLDYPDVNTLVPPNTMSTFLVPGVCPSVIGSVYSYSVYINYTEPGQVFSGPYISTGSVFGKTSSKNSYIIIAMADSNYTDIASTFTDTVIKRFGAFEPYFVMKSPNSSYILFRNSTDSFSIVNINTLAPAKIVNIPNAGQGIYSLNGSFLYLFNGTGKAGDLVAYSLDKNSVTQIIPIPTNCISTLGVSDTGDVYITNENGWPTCGLSGQNYVFVVSPSAGKIIKNITGLSYPVFVQAVNGTVWVGNWEGDTVSVFNSTTNSYIINISTGPNPQAITYSNGNVYLTEVKSPNSSLLIINPKTYAIEDNITLPNFFGDQVPGVAVTPNGYVYISYRSNPGHIAVLSPPLYQMINNITDDVGPYDDIEITP